MHPVTHPCATRQRHHIPAAAPAPSSLPRNTPRQHKLQGLHKRCGPWHGTWQPLKTHQQRPGAGAASAAAAPVLPAAQPLARRPPPPARRQPPPPPRAPPTTTRAAGGAAACPARLWACLRPAPPAAAPPAAAAVWAPAPLLLQRVAPAVVVVPPGLLLCLPAAHAAGLPCGNRRRGLAPTLSVAPPWLQPAGRRRAWHKYRTCYSHIRMVHPHKGMRVRSQLDGESRLDTLQTQAMHAFVCHTAAPVCRQCCQHSSRPMC